MWDHVVHSPECSLICLPFFYRRRTRCATGSSPSRMLQHSGRTRRRCVSSGYTLVCTGECPLCVTVVGVRPREGACPICEVLEAPYLRICGCAQTCTRTRHLSLARALLLQHTHRYIHLHAHNHTHKRMLTHAHTHTSTDRRTDTQTPRHTQTHGDTRA